MGVKRKKQKKIESAESWARAVKIKCCHCENNKECPYRERKEKLEKQGVITWCTKAPKPKKKKKNGNRIVTKPFK